MQSSMLNPLFATPADKHTRSSAAANSLAIAAKELEKIAFSPVDASIERKETS